MKKTFRKVKKKAKVLFQSAGPSPSHRSSLQNNSNSADQLSLSFSPTNNNNEEQLQPLSVPNTRSTPVELHPPFSLNEVQHFHMGSANIYESHGNQNINNNYGPPSSLKYLKKCAMLGATFDSSTRYPPPRCHPETRRNILHSIQEKIHEPSKKAKIAWLKGGAGVGKSAIMQTVAEAETDSNTLGASLFFSRTNNTNDPQKVFTTIAYQLAVKIPSYQGYLVQRIAADPSFMNKTLEKQFQDLIVVPFAQQKLLAGLSDQIILIDGLDECEGNQEQCKIIELIHDFVSNNSTVPLLWVIASRPEEHLLDTFSEIKTQSHSHYWEKEVPINSEQSVRDVERYLRDEFTKISKRYRRLIPVDAEWPNENQFLIISGAASGLFVFASTVIRFIDDNENPLSRLNVVVSVLEKHLKGQTLRTNPLQGLDKLYERILSEISADALDTTKLILGYLIIHPYVYYFTDLSFQPFWICNILGLEQHVMYGALRKLRSVLSFPEPEDAFMDGVQFLHASFSDYLRDEKRSRMYFVNLDKIATHLWNRFMMIEQQWMENQSDDGMEFSWSPESLMKTTQKKIIVAAEKSRTNPDTAFRLLLLPEDLIGQLKQCDYSYERTISLIGDTDRVIRCLEQHIPSDLYNDLIQDVSLVSLEKNRFLRSLSERRWSSDIKLKWDLGHEYKQHFANTDEFEQFLSEESIHNILDLMESADSTKVVGKVLGVRPYKCRVLLRNAESGEPLYCFPYIA